MFQVCAVLRHLSFGLPDFGLQNQQLRLGDVLLVQRHLVILLRVIECRGGNHTVLCHAVGAFIRALQQGHIRALGVDFGALQIGVRAAQTGSRSLQLCARLVHPGLNLVPVEFGEHLALLNCVAIINIKLFHDTAGLRLDLNLGDRLDLARGHHAFRQISFFDLGKLRGINLGAARGRNHHAGNDQSQNHHRDRTPEDDPLAPLLLAAAITFHDRLLLPFKS